MVHQGLKGAIALRFYSEMRGTSPPPLTSVCSCKGRSRRRHSGTAIHTIPMLFYERIHTRPVRDPQEFYV